MSTQSAAESLILEFVASAAFESHLRRFIQGDNVRKDNLLGILRQFVNSPFCHEAHIEFWTSPGREEEHPESSFDDNNDNQ